jgi:hypothetical protein
MKSSFFILTSAAIFFWVATDGLVGQEGPKTDSGSPAFPLTVNVADTLTAPDTLLSIDTSDEEFEGDDSFEMTEEGETLPLAAPAESLSPFGALHVTHSVHDTLKKTGPLFYPGISILQDSLANEMIRKIWCFDWDGVEKFFKKMQKLEKKERLASLSSLLMVSSCIVHVQNGGFSSKRNEKKCLAETEKYARMGLTLSDPSKCPDSLLATHLFIQGGIKGLLATQQIGRNPVTAGIDGLSALGMLEKSLALYPANYDAYLGLGIFYCALAKASPMVRGALNLIGRPVSLEKGLSYLRKSAYEGHYTTAFAGLYLIQFLSPYQSDQASEKNRIFKSLEFSFPSNPCFLFLNIEENLCFHPEKAFDPSIRRAVRKKIIFFDDDEYSKARFANLIRWQYLLIDPFANAKVHPDTTFDLQEFGYYPAFLTVLREKYIVPEWEKASPSTKKKRLSLIKKRESKILKTLASSSMSASWRGFFAWHVRDALRVEN